MAGTNSLVRDVSVLVRDLDVLLETPKGDPRLEELKADWLQRHDALYEHDALRQQESRRLLDAHARFTDHFKAAESVNS